MTSFKPPWLRAYAKSVMVVFGLLAVVYAALGVISLLHLTDPALESEEIFVYANIETSEFLYGLSDETRFVFEHLSPEEFEEKREELRQLAIEDRARNLPKIMGQTFGYAALFLLVAWVHWRLLRQ